MSLASENPIHPRGLVRHELEVLHGNWGWYLALGIALIVLGTLALGVPLVTTMATVGFLGGLLILAGVLQLVGAFWSRRWSGVFSHLLMGLLYVVAGVLMVENPGRAAVELTLLIAIFLVVGGAFRIISAASAHYPGWGWTAFNGLVNVILGVLIWRQWPASGLWIIGLFMGIEMIFAGWTWVMLAMAFRRLPGTSAAVRRV